jgi:predicted ribosomally synthesized peptide with SipW-like signal peptide
MVIGLVCALIGAGVYAVFSDTETSTGNTFTAGTLNLVPSTSGTGPAGKYTPTAGGDGVNGKVVFIKLAPGDSGSITWTLQNDGNLDGTLTMPSTVTFDENGSNEPESAVGSNNGGSNGDLDEYMGVRLKRDGNYILGDASNYVPFSGLEAVLDAQSRSLTASGTLTYVLEWEIASNVKGAGTDGEFGTADDTEIDDNIIQSDKATLDITFTLTQA